MNRWLPAAVVGAALAAGCSTQNQFLPRSGPALGSMEATAASSGVAVQPLTLQEAQALAKSQAASPDLNKLPAPQRFDDRIAAGDKIDVTLIEAAPAMLLGGSALESQGSRSLSIGAQVVGPDGTIQIPFVGNIQAAGRRTTEIQAEIVKALKGRANQPQAVVRQVDSSSQEVAVVGEVRQPRKIVLGAKEQRVLDAIALAGGTSAPVEKTVVSITRQGQTARAPLQSVLRDPAQNVILSSGDIVAVYHKPQHFVALGAVTTQGEVPMEATGVTLAQALARVGGMQDGRAAAHGVYVARASGERPLVWRVDLSQPEGLFVMRNFSMQDGDIVYVANANAADLQKFLNLVGAALAPAATLANITN